VLGIPVLQQTVPYAAHFRSEHPAFLGALTRNQQRVRAALEPYDLLVFLGGDVLRMSVHSPVDPMPPGRAVIQIAERDWELGKNYPAELAVRADVKATLRALVDHLRATQDAAEAAAARSRLDALAADNWSARRVALAARAEAVSDRSPLEPLFLTRVLADAKGVSADEIASRTTSNALALFDKMPGLPA
jgi:benzoylformate decarboxylase